MSEVTQKDSPLAKFFEHEQAPLNYFNGNVGEYDHIDDEQEKIAIQKLSIQQKHERCLCIPCRCFFIDGVCFNLECLYCHDEIHQRQLEAEYSRQLNANSK